VKKIYGGDRGSTFETDNEGILVFLLPGDETARDHASLNLLDQLIEETVETDKVRRLLDGRGLHFLGVIMRQGKRNMKE